MSSKNASRAFLQQVFSVAMVLSLVSLEFLRPVLKQFYAEEWRWKKFDCIAMLKLSVYKRWKKKGYTALIRYLRLHPSEARLLGFTKCIPSAKTLWHWDKVRVKAEGFRKIFAEVVWEIQRRLKKFGIILGKSICGDTTPIQSTRKDKDEKAKYNKHYKMKMYKGGIITDILTGIAIAYDEIIGGTDGDGARFKPFVEMTRKILNLEHFDFMCWDGSYDTFENFYYTGHVLKTKLFVKFAEGSIFHKEATEQAILKRYQRYWRDKDFILPPVKFTQVLDFLAKKGETELIGMYYRNLQFKQSTENEEEYGKSYHQRSKSESTNGIHKDNVDFGRLRENGSNNAEIHLASALLSFNIVVPLFLLQKGITTGLTKTDWVEA